MTAVYTPIAGALGYYVVRDAARRQGLGSLIASGRSIGATLGFLWLVQFYRAVNWGSTSLGGISAATFALLLFLSFLYVVALSLVGLELIMAGSQAAMRFKRRYTVGFYFSYLALCGLLLLLALLKIPYGIASP